MHVMSLSKPAKTVSFSPLRPGHVSFKNTLDNPIKLKWPEVPSESVEALMVELKNSLSGMKTCTMRCNKTQKRKNKRKKSKQTSLGQDSEPTHEPPTKKQCLEDSDKTDARILPNDTSSSTKDQHIVDTTPDQTSTETNLQTPHKDPRSNILDGLPQSKRSQMVIGVNEVSRCLERRGLEGIRGGMVCLSAQPTLILRHIMMLAATRGVPFVALPSLSQTVAPLLGVKTALAIGFKRVASDDEKDHFIKIVNKITKLAPPINIPWLTTVPTETQLKLHQDTDQEPTDRTDELASTCTAISTKLEQDLSHRQFDTETEKNSATKEHEGTVPSESVAGEQRAEGSKNRGQYLPLQIKRVITTKKFNKTKS